MKKLYNAIIAINRNVAMSDIVFEFLNENASRTYNTKNATYWIFNDTWDEYGDNLVNPFLNELEFEEYGKLIYAMGEVTETGDVADYGLNYSVTLTHPKGKL